MSSKESRGVQSFDRSSPVVEAWLQQMTLRGPSDQLDTAIGFFVAADEASEKSRPVGVRFGWPAIFSTAVAAMLAGVWLGSFFLPVSGRLSNSILAVGDSIVHDSPLLTSVSFNVEAFNLLHGHSQKSGFENCGQCHSSVPIEDGTLEEIFASWFYGDEHFFNVHLNGVDDCSKCHAVKATNQDRIENEMPNDFAKLVRCSQCHKVDADGFGGFKTDWRHAGSSSEG